MSNALEIRELHYSAGSKFEITHLNLNVPESSIYGFLGPNGCGKTTTIRLVLGLLRPVGGRITVLGRPMPDQADQILARVGYVPEKPHLDPMLTVRETLRFQAAFYPTWDWPWAERLLQQFELDETRPFGNLSKGQMGKLMMLLALAQRPELLVLDEPTDGLDPVVRREMLSALLEYVSQRHATILVSSHLVHELDRICSWVAVMDNGRLVLEVPLSKFKNGLKRLHVTGVPPTPAPPPFVMLARTGANGGEESWTVREWEPSMTTYFDSVGASLRNVVDLDLEDGYVELLRSFRGPRS